MAVRYGTVYIRVLLAGKVCRFSLLSGQNVRWPRRMLPLPNHDEYADGTAKQTDGRQTVTICVPLDVAIQDQIGLREN